MKLYLLQYTDASFSVSTDDEYIDSIEIASLDESTVDDYIRRHKIVLGKSHLHDNNYQYYTKKVIELNNS